MQFDKDMNSAQAELFLKVRGLIMDEIGDDVKEKFSDNITSYMSKEGGYCYLRVKDGFVHIGWFRGVNFDDKYGLLFGNGKVIRGQKLKSLSDTERESIIYYINQTREFLDEHNELMKMKKKLVSGK